MRGARPMTFSPLELRGVVEENHERRKNMKLVDGYNRTSSSNRGSAKVQHMVGGKAKSGIPSKRRWAEMPLEDVLKVSRHG